MAYDLIGKVALITGGAQGIGLAIAKQLLRNDVKAVTIADINAEKGAEAIQKLTQEFGANRTVFVKTDVTKSEQLEGALKKTIDTWNAIDIVINNAGFAKDEQWEIEISVNCNAVVHGTLLGLQYMGKDRNGKGGTIVNIASSAGIVPFPFMPIYSGTKHFVVGFSRALGDSYHHNRTGVRILTMCPGPTDTSIVSEAVQFPLSIRPEVGKEISKIIDASVLQPAEKVGEGVMTIIKQGESGDVWLIEDSRPVFKLQLPTTGTLEDQLKNLTSK